MDDIISIIIAVLALVVGGGIGYYMRQSLAKKRAGTLEAKLQKRVIDVKQETSDLVKNAEKKSAEILEKTQKEVDERRKESLNAQQVLLKRETLLTERIASFETKEKELAGKRRKVKSCKRKFG